MKIIVLLNDEKDCIEVPAILLDALLAKGKVKAFLRADGWVLIGKHPIRGQNLHYYKGPERRYIAPENGVQANKRSCLTCPEMIDGQCVSNECPDRHKRTRSV
ncbi:MAG: GSU3473 family protein [Geobacteraceae bacterium]|jgi:hypothetical protein